jgi:uncharacterized sporulation protein YeaH/YhbH (DUF444 family)
VGKNQRVHEGHRKRIYQDDMSRQTGRKGLLGEAKRRGEGEKDAMPG